MSQFFMRTFFIVGGLFHGLWISFFSLKSRTFGLGRKVIIFDINTCPKMNYVKSFHFKKTFVQSSFLSNCGTFQYNNNNYSDKYHNFERNEDHATVFLK